MTNPYVYCGNNPVMFSDPDGEFFHLIFGALIGGIVNWVANGADFTWEGLGYFGVGVLSGAIGAGIGTGVSSTLPIATQSSVGGFSAGFWGTKAATVATSSFASGAAIGASSGLSSGFITGFGNGLLGGQNLGDAFEQGVSFGLTGGASGGLIGGIAGGIRAALDGRRFWDGAKVVDRTIVDQNIPSVGQIGRNNCLGACTESVDKSFGGDFTQNKLRNILGGDPDLDPLEDIAVWDTYQDQTGHKYIGHLKTDPNRLACIQSNMLEGKRVSITLDTGTVGHSVVMKSIVARFVQKINGDFSLKYLYNVMNPANGGGITRLSASEIYNAANIFYISR